MREYHLDDQSRIRLQAFANAPSKVICISKSAANTFRRNCYRYRENNREYQHIKLKLENNAVLFLPKQ